MGGKAKSWRRISVFALNIPFALLLLLSYLAVWVPPDFTTLFAFLALAYPLLLLFNFGFVLFWLLKFDRRILLSVLAVAVGYAQLPRLYQFDGQNKVVNPQAHLKVMSFNVRMFNTYNWIDNPNLGLEIKDYIQGSDPDVLMIQEYYQMDKTPKLDFPYEHAKMTNMGRNYGLAIYSKFPIVDRGTLLYDGDTTRENNAFLYADLVINGNRVRCINAHLASIGLDNTDYKRLENPTEGSQEDIERGFLQIFSRLHRAFVRRGVQVNALRKAIENSPYPVILAGDFNDTPSSYAYGTISSLLSDSYVDAGRGFSKTYVNRFLPLRIDYIFHPAEWRAFNYKVGQQKLSDHYPVEVELEY